jgi:uncharacterized membrane protein YidH (DUF202 family)
MGSMDCVTTVIGILYFGAVECNPFLTGMASTNLPAFIILKAVTTVFICLIFYQADKILMKTQDKHSKAFKWTRILLKVAYVGIVVFMVVVVANNIMVLARAL